ncbi:MAG: DNRLRE domain-containing protein [Chloroflexota bacterium]
MSQFTSRPGNRRQLWLLFSISALIVLLLTAAVPTPAQGIIIEDEDAPVAAQSDYPTDEEVASKLQPEVLKTVRRGDKTTVTIQINAGSDTFTSSNQPNTNWANDPNLRVGFNTLGNPPLGAERTFLYFDVSSIPSNMTVQSAMLQMWINSFSPADDSPMGILARFLNSGWDPNTITWNNYNPSWGRRLVLVRFPPRRA